MNEKNQKQKYWESQIFREMPSQIPVHTIKSTYDEMLRHCTTQSTGGLFPVWACKLNGAPVHARMVQRTICERTTGLRVDYAPVVELYCSGCMKPPQTRKGDPVFADELRTLAM